MNHFTYQDRKTLEESFRLKISYRKIKKIINKSISSISYEFYNNRDQDGIYRADIAHLKAIKRKAEKRKRSKLEIRKDLKDFIIKQIKEDLSPEQIAGSLNKDVFKTVISHETIYTFIYSEEGKRLKLWKHLRHKKRGIRKAFGSRKHRSIISNRVSISLRPPEINKCEELGHWEGDLVIFSKIRNVLAVFTERKTGICKLRLLPNKTADEMYNAMCLSVESGFEFKSLTLDNGTENVRHHELKYIDENIDTYFCHPYCSWEKGSVENLNGLIRQYLPRKVDKSKLNQNFIRYVEDKLNNRPRKRLGYISPLEFYKKCSV